MRKPIGYPIVFVAVIFVIAAAISSAAATAPATVKLNASHSVVNSVHSCAPWPSRIRANLVPVWAKLEIRTPKNVLVTGMGLMIRRYVGPKHAVDLQPGVFSGCYALLTFNKHNVPKRLCITIKAGLTAPDGACQPVEKLPSGQRSVVFGVQTP